jgi:hypothetical protein
MVKVKVTEDKKKEDQMGLIYSCTLSLTSALDVVGGHRDAPVVLPQNISYIMPKPAILISVYW